MTIGTIGKPERFGSWRAGSAAFRCGFLRFGFSSAMRIGSPHLRHWTRSREGLDFSEYVAPQRH